ncbi:kinase-like domain-containing protein [Xylariaceae sp. FL0662B]|nr:kinase-like domain-containing protein [Xylariaceae sp. FL0662B]
MANVARKRKPKQFEPADDNRAITETHNPVQELEEVVIRSEPSGTDAGFFDIESPKAYSIMEHDSEPLESALSENSIQPSQGQSKSRWAGSSNQNQPKAAELVTTEVDSHEKQETGPATVQLITEKIKEDDEDEQPFQCPNYVDVGIENIENLHDYVPGGHHPVHFGDILNDRFEIVHKAGNSDVAIVWLCFDLKSEEWRAVKIIRADQSHEDRPELKIAARLKEDEGFGPSEWEAHHITLPLDHFWLQGPNGRHLCEVLPLLGPPIKSKWNSRMDDLRLAEIKDLLYQAAEALHFLHRKGICHGDFRSENMLLRLEDLSKFGKEKMIELLGDPCCRIVTVHDGPDPGRMAPKYVIKPVDLTPFTKNEVAIVGFGESFRVRSPPESLGIPCKYAAPEVRLGGYKLSLGIDVWSLACTILDVRVNDEILGPDLSSYVASLEVLFGPLPEPYRNAYLKQLDDVRQEGKRIPIVSQLAKEASGKIEPLEPLTNIKVFKRLSNLKDELGQKLAHTDRFFQTLARSFEYSGSELDENGNQMKDAQWVTFQFKIPDDEVPILGDLLRKVIKYDPDDRIDIETVLHHEWFRGVNSWLEETTTTPSTPFLSEPDGTKSPRLALLTSPNLWHRWAQLRQSRAFQNMRDTIPKSFIIYFIIGSILATALWAVVLYIISLSMQLQLDMNRSPCYQEAFIIRTMVRSSTSTYFEGVYHSVSMWPILLCKDK